MTRESPLPRLSHRALAALAGLALTGLALAGCGDSLDEQLGLEQPPPDEFRVVERAPLSVPPRFQLRPPEPGAPRPQEGTARQRAETAVFTREGERDETARRQFADSPGLSPGERRLLANAGADEAEDDIRQVVNRESDRLREANEALLEDLIFWRDAPQPGTVVDADAEARRIRENQAVGDDVTAGETPTIEPEEKGFLEGLVN
jgi:hypothetical protein